eukprot:Trichotokara_eunicae@DN6450_c0_g1_i1.p1
MSATQDAEMLNNAAASGGSSPPDLSGELRSDVQQSNAVVGERVLVREERILLDRKFKFGSDLEEYFLLLESRCSARNIPTERYLGVFTEDCEDVASASVTNLTESQYRAMLLAAPPGESYLWVRKQGFFGNQSF